MPQNRVSGLEGFRHIIGGSDLLVHSRGANSDLDEWMKDAAEVLSPPLLVYYSFCYLIYDLNLCLSQEERQSRKDETIGDDLFRWETGSNNRLQDVSLLCLYSFLRTPAKVCVSCHCSVLTVLYWPVFQFKAQPESWSGYGQANSRFCNLGSNLSETCEKTEQIKK